MSTEVDLPTLRKIFGSRLQEDVSLKRYTAARLGGNADAFIPVNSSEELAETSRALWEREQPFVILGSGSNVLVSDAGVHEVVILNRAKKIQFSINGEPPSVWVESGANLGALARLAASHGLGGMEWAVGIPGTIGGAIYGNAGAHGGDMASSLVMANILQLKTEEGNGKQVISQEEWPVERFGYGYRSSQIKRNPGSVAILDAKLMLTTSTIEAVQLKMDAYNKMRQGSQPSGASLGSIFKNPAGDYAGRLIEAAGLKGMAVGKVEISTKHANFFINRDNALASDYAALIKLAQQTVAEKFGVHLELEIELLGDWSENWA